ncbi:MAG: (Fe-S)-binding protein [Acidimicrobiia bacterium]
MAWSTPWAPTPAELNACVECGLCLPHCPTFRLTGDESASPRGRLNAMSAVASGLVPIDEAFDEVMSFCLQCRACEAACPSLVPFGRAMEGARAEVAAVRHRGSRLRRRMLGRWIGRPGLIGAASWGAAAAQRVGVWLVPPRLRPGLRGLRRLPWRRRSVVGYDSLEGDGVVGLLAGCVMDPWFGPVHEATIALLEKAGHRVVVPAGQTCCGALAAHEGAAEDAERMAQVNAGAFADVDVVVSNAAGCSSHLVGYSHWGQPDVGEKADDVLRLIAAAVGDGRLPALDPSGDRVAIHDPCHHRHALRMTAEPRIVLRAAGYEPIDVDPAGMCCGAAGVYSVLHPETSSRLGGAKAAEVAATGCSVVASANPGCEMQLRAHLGEGVRVAHPLELYAEALGVC